MAQPPRSAKARLVTGRLLWRAWGILGVVSAVLSLSAFFVVLLSAGWSPGATVGVGSSLHDAYREATTATFAAIVACQIGTAFAARTERVSLLSIGLSSNRPLIGGIAFELLFTAMIVYTPAAHRLLGTASLSWPVLALLVPFPVVVWGVDEAYRWWRRTVEPS